MSMVNESNLAIIRKVYRLSCEEIGALMGVSGQFVSYVERGARNLPAKRAEKLAEILALTPEKLALIIEVYEAGRKSSIPSATYTKMMVTCGT